MAITKYRAITSTIPDGSMCIPVLQHLELPVQLVFQGEQESSAAACEATSCWKDNKVPLRWFDYGVYTKTPKKKMYINCTYTTRNHRGNV